MGRSRNGYVSTSVDPVGADREAGDAVPDGDEWRALAAVTGKAGNIGTRAELVSAAVLMAVATGLGVAGLLAMSVGLLVAAVVVGTGGAIWWGEARRRGGRGGR
jgi:hypothetical protein